MRKLERSWTLKLLVSLSTILISVTQVQATEQTIEIEQGVPAKFKGVLVPEWQFRKMSEDLMERDFLKDDLHEIQTMEETSPLRGFVVGFLVGSLTVLAIDKFGSK